MKSLSETNNVNWLGVSLSPHMKMDVSATSGHHPQDPHFTASSAVAVPSNFYLPSSQFSSPTAICYGNGGENVNFHSSLSVMPLNSDGSLCLMEAITISQQEGIVPSSSPKLEDFLGCARETMALSLDSMYYHHNNTEQQNHPYYEMYRTQLDNSITKNTQLSKNGFPQIGDDNNEICSLKNWVATNYSVPVGAIDCGDLQSLSLSMSPGSQSSCITASRQISPVCTESMDVETKKRGSAKVDQKHTVRRKSIDTFGQRTSQYRGVTRHRWTGRFEAHLWDNSCKREGQTRKGRQVYLGGYDMEEKAARAYDLAAIKYWGPSTHINFPLQNYQEELEEMKNMSRQEYVAHLRRKSSGFSRGASIYRGVTRHHQHGRWQARIGRVAGNKDLYLGTFSTQEEAAEAYDIAAIKFRGVNAVTNFDITKYHVERILASNTLLAGELARRTKDNETSNVASQFDPSARSISESTPIEAGNGNETDWNEALHPLPSQPKTNASADSRDPKSMSGGNYQGLLAMQDLDNPSQSSNPSSLVTSLSSSREASPDRTGSTMVFAKPQWLQSTRSAAEISMADFPAFAAWNDA